MSLLKRLLMLAKPGSGKSLNPSWGYEECEGTVDIVMPGGYQETAGSIDLQSVGGYQDL